MPAACRGALAVVGTRPAIEGPPPVLRPRGFRRNFRVGWGAGAAAGMGSRLGGGLKPKELDGDGGAAKKRLGPRAANQWFRPRRTAIHQRNQKYQHSRGKPLQSRQGGAEVATYGTENKIFGAAHRR